MKKMKLLILLVLVLSLLCTACKGDACEHTCPNCGKCTDDACESEKCTCDSQQDALCTLSGLTGEGYSFTAEGYTVTADGKLQAEAGTQLKLALVLGESYYTGDPVVKLDGQTLTAENGTYTVTLNADSVLALEGACFYEVIARYPFGLKPEGSVDEVGGPMSKESSVIKAAWTAGGYSFANTKLEPYYSVMFYARAEGCWLSFRDRLGQFNKKDTAIYANGVKNPESGKMEPDSAWHKYEFVRQSDERGVISYALYVDGQKHTRYDEKTQVDARLQNQLNDLLLDLNGTYYVSELFGCADPNYVVDDPDFYIAEQSPFAMEADGLLTDDYPCGESIRYNLYYKPQWSQEKPANFPMEPYSAAKFYIGTPATGWITCQVNGKDVAIMNPGSGWHEFLLESTGVGYMLTIDGESTGESIRSNLSELLFNLNDATYHISELFVIDDPNFDGVIDDPYGESILGPDLYGTAYAPAGTVSVLDNPFTFPAELSGHTPFTSFDITNKLDTTWNKYSFQYLDLVPYKSVMFAVKTRAWYGMMTGDRVISEMEGNGGWRLIRLSRISGNKWQLYYGATAVETVTLPSNNLSDLSFRFGTDTYYVTDLRAVIDPAYKDPFELIIDNPIKLLGTASKETADGFEKSTRLDTAWNRYSFNSVDLAPYTQVKFAVKSNGWYGIMDGDAVIDETNGTGSWTVFKLVKGTDGWTVYYGNKEEKTLVLPENNLADLSFRFGTDSYLVTELRGIPDPNYVPPQYVNVTKGDPFGVGAAACEDRPDAYFVTGSYQYMPAVWSSATFQKLDVLAWKDLRFFVKAPGQENKWLELVKGSSQLMAVQDDGWHEIRLKKSGGKVEVYADGMLKAQVHDLSQLALRFSENATYTYTDVYGIADETYVPATVTVTAPAGCTVTFRLHQPDGGVLKVEKGTTVYFEVQVDQGYEGTPVVKANGQTLTHVYGLYTLTVDGDTVITVEGVNVKADDYELIHENPFELSGTQAADQAPASFQHVTKLDTTWNKYSFKDVDLNKYTAVKFAVKSAGWFGVMEGDTAIDETTAADWLVIKLVKGDGGWTLYYGDKEEKTLVLPNSNLTDLSFRFGSNTYYVTELLGLPAEDTQPESTYVQAAANLVDREPTSTSSEDLPSGDVSVVNSYNCGWVSPGAAAGITMDNYTELKFLYKVGNAGKWFELYGPGGSVIYQGNKTTWTELKLVQETGSWTLFVDGVRTKEGLNGKTFEDIIPTLTLGGDVTADVYVTDLVGIPAADTKPESAYTVVAENLVNADPTGTTSENLPSTDVTKGNIFQCGWTSPGVADGISLAGYTELKFWYTVTSASKWFELYGPGNSVIYQGNKTTWTELKFVLEGESWTLYVNEVWTKGGLTGTTLKELLPTLTLGGSVTADVYVTQLIGKKAESAEGPAVPESGYTVVTANLVNTAPSSTVTENLPSEDVSRANVFNCGWTSPGMTDGITLAEYTELKFWYKVSDEGKWFEMYDADGDTVYAGNVTAWTEVKFLWEQENQAWTLYVDGQWKKTGMTGTVLSDIVKTLTLGGGVTADVYVTELIGLKG